MERFAILRIERFEHRYQATIGKRIQHGNVSIRAMPTPASASWASDSLLLASIEPVTFNAVAVCP